ncbi:MAG: hypothetical protein WBA74_18670 [Cyclobacteriaceae bacterium]
MRQTQINKLEMMKTTNTYLDKMLVAWSGIPVMDRYKAELANLILQISEKALDQLSSRIFIGETQLALKKEIGMKLSLLDNVLETFAVEIGDVELMVISVNTKTDYTRLTNEEFETKCRNMIGMLEKYTDDLGEYGFSTDELADVKTLFDRFLERRGKPRAYRVTSRIATQELKDLFAEATKLLTKMDKILSRFEVSDPSFYNGYLAARLVVNK